MKMDWGLWAGGWGSKTLRCCVTLLCPFLFYLQPPASSLQPISQ